VQLGSLEAAKAEARSFGWDGSLDAVRHDSRLAIRGLRRNKGFTATAVISLALGIGVLTAMFSLINAVLFRPLPYRDPGSLALIWTDDARRGLHREATAWSTISDWQAQSKAFGQIAFFSAGRVAPMSNDPGAGRGRSRSALVSGNFFDVLGVAPADGRLISAADERDRAPVVVISHGFWQRWLGGAPGVVGQSLKIDDASKGGLAALTIVGILPQGFYFPDKQTELYTPATTYWRFARESSERFPAWARRWTAVGRLADGRTIEGAREEFGRIEKQLTASYPTTIPDFPGFSTTVMPVLDSIAGAPLQASLWMLLAAVGALLLVVCGNLSTLMLARGSARQREFAVQRALGAGRSRVIRQVLIETLLLVGAGGLIGTALASWTTPLMASLIAPYVPRMDELAFDTRVWLFAAGSALVSGAIFGLIPALRVSGAASSEALREGGRGTATPKLRRTQRALVFVECLLAIVLLAGAGLMLRSLHRLYAVDAGFDPSHVLTVRLEFPSEPPPTAEERLQTSQIAPARARGRLQLFNEAIERVSQIPGVEMTAAVDDLFVAGQGNHSITIPGRASDQIPAGELNEAAVSSAYFTAMGQSLRRGRLPVPEDAAQKIRALWSPIKTDLPLAEKERLATP
jgi:predicted permease